MNVQKGKNRSDWISMGLNIADSRME